MTDYFNISVTEINKCFDKYKRGKTKAMLRAEEKQKRLEQIAAERTERVKQEAQRIQDKNSFANRMYALRKYKGLTQRQLADGIKIAVSMVSMWETGRHYPGPKYRLGIVEFLTKPLVPVYINPYDAPTPNKHVYVTINELSAMSPMGFRYTSACAPELPEVFNENVADMGETVRKEMFNGFNL